MEMDCGTCIIFIRFRIPDQVYCNKSQKNNNFLFKTFYILHRPGSALHFPFMWMILFMLKEERCKCEWKPTTKYTTKYICLVSFLHIHTNYLDLQACKKLAHGGVKAFDDYMCNNVNMKKSISYIVNENNKICYTVQYIKWFTHFYHDMHILFIYWWKWHVGILNK